MYLLRLNFFLFLSSAKKSVSSAEHSSAMKPDTSSGLVVIGQFKEIGYRPAGARLGVGGAVDHSAQP